jgi:uncharacterized membrane protein YedE/YeeE
MPDLEDVLLNPKFPYLMIGALFLAAVVASVCTGKTFGRSGGVASRAKEPTQFSWGVAIYFLAAIFGIGIWLHEAYRLSN